MTLYKLFYDFCFSKNQDAASANQFATHMVTYFTTSRKIVLIAKNLDDGIGDYVSQLYFAKKLMQLLKGYPDVNIKIISYVSEKKRVIADKIGKELFDNDQIFTLFSDDQPYKSQPLIIGIPKNESQENFLYNIMESADFIFNIAIGLSSSVDNQLEIKHSVNFDPASEIRIKIPDKKNIFLNSWVQYDYKSSIFPKQKDCLLTNYTEYYKDSPIYAENAMGIHPDQMGLRFIDSIQETIKKNRLELLQALGTDNNFKRYIPWDKSNTQSFATGYLQSSYSTGAFVLMAAQTSPNKDGDMNAFVNTDFYDDTITNREYPDQAKIKNNFDNTLRNLGFTHIEMITDFNQEPKVTVLNESAKKRTLRLIKFTGISEKTKADVIALSEMVCGSGDTSISEVITSGLKQTETALPFFQQYVTSNASCNQSILEALEAWRNGDEHQELCDYFTYLVRNNVKILGDAFFGTKGTVNFVYNADGAAELEIQKNREKIVTSWNKFCQFLFYNRNEASHFNELLVTYTFHRLLINNQLELFKELSASLGKNAFKNETLLHLAVKLNHTEIAEYLIKNELCDLNKTHCYNGYTALHMAVHQGNEDLIKLLISSPDINLNTPDRGGRTPLLLSAIVGNNNIFKMLYTTCKPSKETLQMAFILAAKNKHEEILKQLKSFTEIDENNPTIKKGLNDIFFEAVINNDTELAAFLISKGVDVNYQKTSNRSPLSIAVQKYTQKKDSNTYVLIELLLKNKANPNIANPYNYPLSQAAMHRDIKLFEQLVLHGAQVEIIDPELSYKDIYALFGNEYNEKLNSLIGKKQQEIVPEKIQQFSAITSMVSSEVSVKQTEARSGNTNLDNDETKQFICTLGESIQLFIQDNQKQPNKFYSLQKNDMSQLHSLLGILKTDEKQISQGCKLLVLDAVIRFGNDPSGILQKIDSMNKYLIEIRAFHFVRSTCWEGSLDALENSILSKLHNDKALPDWSEETLIAAENTAQKPSS